MLIMFCTMLPLVCMAQNRSAKGVVINDDEEPMSGVTVKAVHSDVSVVTDKNGRFELSVPSHVKYIEASLEGFVTTRAEFDGSYVVFVMKVDKQFAKAKAKAAEEAQRAAEQAAAAKAKAEQEAKRVAEQEAIAKAKAEEDAKRAAEEVEEKARRVAEQEAIEKAKAEEEARRAAERAAITKAKAAEKAKRAAEKEALKKVKAEKARERAERNREIYGEHLSGYGSMVEITYANGLTPSSNNVGLNYIGGYRFNNYFFVGLGAGVRVPFALELNKLVLPEIGTILPNDGLGFPLFAHFRANFINGRVSPFFALSAGVHLWTPQRMKFTLLETSYSNIDMFVNPQIGVNYRLTKELGVYLSVGYNGYTNRKCTEKTVYNATFNNVIQSELDVHIGVTF